jgi:dephospho-CoA kinase
LQILKTEKQTVIGITGGIGVGKSLVCRLFQIFGIPVFNADETAKKIIETDAELKEAIIQLLGSEAYKEGAYNRKYVGGRVFGNKELLASLNALVHPKVKESAIAWLRNQKSAPFYLYEAALMKAAGDNNFFEKIIVVSSPMKMRLTNIMARDKRSESEILAIIGNQISEEERLKIADFRIINDENTGLIKQVLAIYNYLAGQ